VLLFEVFGAQEIVVGADFDESVRAFRDDVRQHFRKTTVAPANIKAFNRRREQFGREVGNNIKVDFLAGTVFRLR
jgi:hypothetical protein